MKFIKFFSLLSLATLLSCQTNSEKPAKLGEPVVPVQVTEESPATDQFIEFGSDASWDTIDSEGKVLGKAQTVYLNETSPSPRPPNAWSYDYPHAGWPADRRNIPNARWIWGPANLMEKSAAEYSQFSFRKRFRLNHKPTKGVISIAVDDAAKVEVNGSIVGAVGSVTSYPAAASANSQLMEFDISHLLRRGSNEIIVHAQNGPNSFAGTTLHDSWSNNPAGVVFGGYLQSGSPSPK